MNLENKSIVLHALIDEYIQSDIGSDILTAISDFVLVNSNFPFIDIEEYKKIKIRINMGYIQSELSSIINNILIDPFIETTNKLIKDFTEYVMKPDNFNKVIPIGHLTHLMGLIITYDKIIITNSGSGLKFHKKCSDKVLSGGGLDDNFHHDECEVVLIFNKNVKYCSDFIFQLLLYSFSNKTDINEIYYFIFKYYYLSKINDLSKDKYDIVKEIKYNYFQFNNHTNDSPTPDYNTTNKYYIKANKLIYDKNTKEKYNEQEIAILFFIDTLFHNSERHQNYVSINTSSICLQIEQEKIDIFNSKFSTLKTILDIDSFFILKSLDSDKNYYLKAGVSGSCTFYGILYAISYIKYTIDNINKSEFKCIYIQELNKIQEFYKSNINDVEPSKNNILILSKIFKPEDIDSKLKELQIKPAQSNITLINNHTNPYSTLDDVFNHVIYYANSFIENILLETYILLPIIKFLSQYNYNYYDISNFDSKFKKITCANSFISIIICYIGFKLIDHYKYFNDDLDYYILIHNEHYYSSFLTDKIKLHIITDELNDFIDIIYKYQFIFLQPNNYKFYALIPKLMDQSRLKIKHNDTYKNNIERFVEFTGLPVINSLYNLFKNNINNSIYLYEYTNDDTSTIEPVNNIYNIRLGDLGGAVKRPDNNRTSYNNRVLITYTEKTHNNEFEDNIYILEIFKEYDYHESHEIKLNTLIKDTHVGLEKIISVKIIKSINTKINICTYWGIKQETEIYDFTKINELLQNYEYEELKILHESYQKNKYGYGLYKKVPFDKLISNEILLGKPDYVYYNTPELIEYYKNNYQTFKNISANIPPNHTVELIFSKFKILFNEEDIPNTLTNQLFFFDYQFDIVNTDDNYIAKYNENINITTELTTKITKFGKYYLDIDNTHQFYNNILRYRKNIPSFFTSGIDNINDPTCAVILFKSEIVTTTKNLWTEQTYQIFNGFFKKETFCYIEFINDNFQSIIPKLDNNYESFLIFATHLLINSETELFNLLLPYVIEADINYNKEYCKLLIKHNFFTSPHRWYYANKVYNIITGNYSDEIISNIDRRKKAYGKFNSLDLCQSIPDIEFEMPFYNKWIADYQLLEKTTFNYLNIKDKLPIIPYNHFDISLDDVLNYKDLIEYVISNYRNLMNQLERNLITKIRNIFESTNDVPETEILGNIKHYIKPTFLMSDNYKDNICNINNYIHLFCIITGKILDKIQYDTIHDLFTDNKKSTTKLYELLMGRGKTYVIIPCIVFILFMKREFYNIIICMPQHLINQSIEIFRQISPFFTDGYLFHINIDRDINDTKYFKEHLDILTHKVIILSDLSIKSYLLNTKEFTIECANHQLNKINSFDDQQLKDIIIKNNPKFKTDNPINMLKEGSFIIYDEFDMLIDPVKSELNYPINKSKNLDMQLELVELISEICNELFLKYSDFMIKSDKHDKIKNTQIIRFVMSSIPNESYKELKSKLDETFNSVDDIDESDKYYMKHHVGGTPENLLLYYVKCIYKVFKSCLDMMINVHYGRDIDTYIVIPFISQNTPMTGSQFSDPIIQIVLTYIYYLTKPFRDDDSLKVIRFLKDINYEADIFEEILTNIKNNEQLKLTAYINSLQTTNKNEHIKFIKFYLTKIIFPEYIKVSHEYYNCSFIDIIDSNFIKNKFALSGTVNVHLTKFDTEFEIKEIKEDKLTSDEITLALTSNNKGSTKSDFSYYETGDILDHICDLMINYQVLIDVGSFLRHYSNLDVVKKLATSYKSKSIIYFDDNDKKQIYKDEQITEFIKIKDNLKIIVYFDQKHTVGVDIDLPSTAKSLLTVNSNTTYTQLVQGLYRMREINYYQSNNYLLKDLKDIKTVKHLIEYIKAKNTLYLNNTTKVFTKQCILNLIRKFHKYTDDKYIYKPFIPHSELDKIDDDSDNKHLIKYFNLLLDNSQDSLIKRYIDEYIKLTDVSTDIMISKNVTTNIIMVTETRIKKIIINTEYVNYFNHYYNIEYNLIGNTLKYYELILKYANNVSYNVIFNLNEIADKNTINYFYLDDNKNLFSTKDIIIYSQYNMLPAKYYKLSNIFDKTIPPELQKKFVVLTLLVFILPTQNRLQLIKDINIDNKDKQKIQTYYNTYFKYNLSEYSRDFFNFLNDT